MNNAVKDGGEKLQGFAKVSGMSGQEFAETWKKDPYKAVQQFEQGLANQNKEGKNVKEMLKELGITELRETDTVLRLANGNKQLQTARENANKGYKEGNALSQEAETKYKTLGNQMKIFMNHVRDLGIEIGAVLAPILVGMMKVLTPVIDALAKAPAPIKLMVVALGLIPIVAVPVLGSLAAITGAMGLMGQAMNTATYAAGRNSKVLRIYAASVGLLTSPIQTTKKALSSLPGIFGRVGKSAQSGAKATSSTGTVLAKTGSQASKSGSLFSKFAGKLKFLAPIGSMLTGVLGTLLSALAALSAPVIIAVTVIGSLVAAFVVAYKKVGWFRDGINGLLYVFKVFGGNIISGAINKVKDFGKWVGNVAGSVGGWAVDKFKSLWKAMAGTSYGKTTKNNFNSFKKGMQELGKASQKSTDQVKVLGKGVSEGTKKALGGYVKYSQKSTEVMAQMRLNNGKESEKLKNALINNSKSAGDELLKQQKKRNSDNVSQLQKMLSDTKVYTGKEADEIVSRAKKAGDEKVKKTEKLNKEIRELESKALADGKLSENERKAIQKKYDERNKLAVETLTKGQKEQRAILSRLDTNVGAINTKEAQDAIKEVINAQNKAIADAKKKRNQLITEADDALANGTITQKEHDNIVKKVQSQYDTETQEAIKKGKESKKKIKKSSPGIEELVNMDSGKSYTKAQQWWNQFSGFMSNIGGQTIKDWGNLFKNIWNANVKFGEWIGNGFANLGGWFSQQGNEFATKFKQGWSIASKAGGDLWGWIKQSGSGIGGWFSQQGSDFANRFKQGWQIASQAGADLWSWIKQTGGSIGGWFAQKGKDFWNSLKNAWGTVINSNPGAMWNSLTSALGTAWAATKQWFITKGQQMGSALSQGWTAMKGFVVNTFGSIWTSIKSIWQGIWSTISYWSGAIWNRVKSVWSWIKNNTVNAFTVVWNTIKRIWSGIKNTIVYWTSVIWNRIKAVWNWIKSNTVGAFTAVWNTIKRIWSGIKGTIVYWTSAIWNRVKAVWNWIKSNTASAFTWVWNKIKSIWKGIKGTIVYWTGAIWNRVKAVWNWIKSNTASAFNWVWNKIKNIWKGIKGTITYWTGAIWNRIKSIWTNIKNFTANIFNSVWGTVKRIWTNIKNAVIDRASSMWGKVKGIWNNLKSGTTDIFNKVKNTVKSAFEFMKKHSVDLVTGMWDKVGKVFGNMKKGVKNFAGNVKDGINGMVDGVKTGLNGLIKAVNWVGGKLGIDKKIPKLHTGTESTHTQSFVSNGAISRPTLATVNDKGSGNGSGSNGHQELIQRKNGSVFAPQGKDVTVPLGKGDRVINGRDTQRLQKSGAIPKFSKGIGSGIVSETMLKDMKKKKKKKDDEEHGAMDAIGSKFAISGGGAKSWEEKLAGSLGTAVGKGAKAKKKVEAGAKAGAKVAGDKIGEILDYVGKPGKLVDAVLGKFGVDFGKVKGEIPKDMMWNPMWKGLKGGVKSLFDGWLTEADGAGDGSYIDLSKGINYGFGHPPGYPFPGGHSGIDINYKYGDKLYSVMSGNAVGTTGWGGGFGRHMEITSGDTKAIYGHMSKLAFNKKRVKPGDYIGNSGGDPGRDGINAGQSTGAHLHFEVQKNGRPIDPIPWLKKNNGGGSKNKKASAWKDDIKRAAKQMKVSLKGNDLNNIVSLINAESGGNAGITQGNIGDINNRNGNPAKGLLQYIPQTFSAYAMKGHKNIKNGYDQLLAFFNNKYWRSQFNPNGGWSPSGPRRFAHGGMIKKHGLYEAGEGNREEMILPLTNKVRAMQLIDQAKSFMGVNDEGSISTVDNNSSDDIVTQLLQQNNRLLEALISTVQNKELIVDEQAIVNTANNGLGKKYKEKSYTRGGI